MKIAIFRHHTDTAIGMVDGNYIIDLEELLPLVGDDLVSLLRAEDDLPSTLGRLLQRGLPRYPLHAVTLRPPIRHPDKFMALGMNYKKHVQEVLSKPQFKNLNAAEQIWFSKQVNCINGPFDPVVKPEISDCLDYEGELAFVIGRRCKDVSAEQAPGVIVGYMIANDVSLRDWQMKTPTMTLAKSSDTHGPVGPWLVTADEIGDPHNLAIRTLVNGEVRQDSNTSDMIFNCYEQVEHLSQFMTLEPGDICITGTPEGVGMGFEPPRFLKVGDVVRIEVEKIGAIEAKIVAG